MRCLTPIALEGGSRLVPCGNCRTCLGKIRDDETMRCLWEIEAASAAWFFTGTFEGAAPDRKVAQASWKAFRVRLERRFPGVEFRFLRVPEFGSRGGRFHWHAIMVAAYAEGMKPVRVDDLDDAWRQGRGSEGFAKVKVLKGPGRDTSFADRVKLSRYVAKYIRGNPEKDLSKRKAAPNVSRSPHFGEDGVSRVVAANPIVAEIVKVFPGARISGVYDRLDPPEVPPAPVLTWFYRAPDWVVYDHGHEVHRFADFDEFWAWWCSNAPADDVPQGDPAPRIKRMYVPGSYDPLRPLPYERVRCFGSGVDPDDLAEAERLRQRQYVDTRDDPNRLVSGPKAKPLTSGQKFNSLNLGVARSARLASKRRSWWNPRESAASRAAFEAAKSQDEGFAHVHSHEDEDSNHWFGD